MLTDEETATIKAGLEADRIRLLGNSTKAMQLTMNRDRDAVGRDSMDESTEEEMYGTALRLHDRETFLLTKIDEALERLAKGELDQCEDCAEPIGYKRLLARPVTTLCIDCKEERENKGL
jgi:DnaK suppressor protein